MQSNHQDRVVNVEQTLSDLSAIRADIIATAAQSRALLDAIHPTYRDSARNLLHYLCLRRYDLRPLQLQLAALGLSSLGRAESQVLPTVDAVLGVLRCLVQTSYLPPTNNATADVVAGQHRLVEHTDALLGAPPSGRDARIMVTMPSAAAREYTLVRNLLQAGMDCMRINCAHDDAATWQHIIENLRQAERATGRSCKIAMDLGGPKLRTGPLQPGPAVVRIRPRRDVYGQVVAPARVWLTAETAPSPPPTSADACLPVPAAWLARLRLRDRLHLQDARDSSRTLAIVDTTDRGCWAEVAKTTYVVPGTVLECKRRGEMLDRPNAAVGTLPPAENAIRLQPGDLLVVTRDLVPGRAAALDTSGRVLTPAAIGCTIPEVFDDVRAGDSIWFDDGKIGGAVEKVEPSQVLVRITNTRPGGRQLRADKGINLPDSNLRLGALTAKDIEDLAFVAQHADIVALSFANSVRDVELLQQHLRHLGAQPAIVLKIETRQGFENLPDMLLAAMRWPLCGVEIARGDLAVECGFERLAEIQEEILWICEAAHVPVIWATQVLETLTKEGMPSRAEITDAAMAHRAECVMLNKGPHVVDAVRILADILQRMRSHQAKKRAMLRKLRLAGGYHRPGGDGESRPAVAPERATPDLQPERQPTSQKQ